MEGLIPYFLHAIKKQRPQHKFRSFSGSNSNRSYQLLATGNDSLEGSSHRRTRSEFPAPAAADLFQQQSELEFAHSRSYKEEGGASAGGASLPGGSKKGFYPYRAASRKYK
ncbi:uncharacterized protein LOC126782263 [Argentina anserina]|uniref:uncharacterized protein LOC126782263 n=1 Tax=Argentina anserina TaxID=57926 RepID=UPI0021764D77|nr:uncharacterized protein LOC126782263 [Potentilla anserina]